MSGVNKVILMGRVGKMDSKNIPSGMMLTTLSIATSEKRLDKSIGEYVEKTSWHRCIAFGKSAEILSQYVKIGSQLYVEGKLEYGSYEKEGVTHYTSDIIINTFNFIGSSSSKDEFRESEKSVKTAGASNKQMDFAPASNAAFADDDIPF